MPCFSAAARRHLQPLPLATTEDISQMGSMLSAGPARSPYWTRQSLPRACPANSPFAVDFATTPAAAAPARPLPPATLQGPFGDAALPAPPPTRQTASASTPTSPPWAWRPAREPAPPLLSGPGSLPTSSSLHSAPSSHCARGPSGPPMLGFLHGPRPHSGPTPTAPGPAARAAVTPFKPGSRPHGHVTPCARPRPGRPQAASL